MKIEWRPVVGFESRYLVSNYGDIKSLHYREPKLLWPHNAHGSGYLRVTLMDGKKTESQIGNYVATNLNPVGNLYTSAPCWPTRTLPSYASGH